MARDTHALAGGMAFQATVALKTYGHVKYLKSVTEGFVRYLLFVDEAPLTAEVRGTSDFQKEFEAVGPRDSLGRSLRQFDLTTRLFKYPCSYLIYSDAFEALPAEIKEKIYTRLYEILSGKDASEEYELISPQSRKAILQILAATKTDLPEFWTRSPELTSSK